MHRWRWLVGVVPGLALAAAGYAVALHVDSARLLTHTVGVFATLAELLRHGVLYPPEPSVDLVYSVFYHPLGFAPYALLPGTGLDLVPGMRVLVGAEVVACLLVVAVLARPLGVLRLHPAAWALCTLPVCFSLVGMRDDPRAALLGLLALWSFGGEHERPPRVWAAAACLTLAFFVKATAPLAPGLALLLAAWRAPGHQRTALRLLAACVGLTAAGVVFLQWGLGCDFLGNGLRYLLVQPARAPRAWGETFSALAADLGGMLPGSPQPWDLALPAIALVSATAVLARLAQRRADRYDVLVAAVWLKTVVVYRSWGTDLNHLFDLALFASLHAGRSLAGWLTPVRSLCVLAILLGLGQPWRRLLPEPGTPSLAKSPLAAAAAALRQQEPVPTLCEEPFLGWLTGSRPLVTDPFLTFAALADHPEIRERWFGPTSDPVAVRRLVLMHDPFADSPYIEHWYRHLHFDEEFLRLVRTQWRSVIVTDTATVLIRR
ncbi:MAG: hypothetical protein R3F56_06805 [Planctomycetota bacterium]